MGEINSFSAAFVKLPQSIAAINVSSKGLYIKHLCELLVYTITTYRIFSVNPFCDNIKSEKKKGGYFNVKKIDCFFSRANENYFNGTLKTLEVGNTEVAAEIIRELTGADIFKIEQTKPYSKGYNDCIAEAKADKQRNARPELKSYPDSLDGYDVIYLGYPNYWSTAPMAVFTCLEHFDLTGKTIKPFCTHEGSGLGVSVSDIKRICPDSTVENGLAIRGSSVIKSKKEISKWIDKTAKTQ